MVKPKEKKEEEEKKEQLMCVPRIAWVYPSFLCNGFRRLYYMWEWNAFLKLSRSFNLQKSLISFL